MALYYRYGTMNSAKTANLVMQVYADKSDNKEVLLLKPDIDSRSGNNKIKSRALAIEYEALVFSNKDNLYNLLCDVENQRKKDAVRDDIVFIPTVAIYIDEAQFLTSAQVKQISAYARDHAVNIFCYGLKNTYVDGVLFEGAQALCYYADTMYEIESFCRFCNEKATMNALVKDGKHIYKEEKKTVGVSDKDGALIGDVKSDSETYYIPVCKKHYYSLQKYLDSLCPT